MAQSRRRTDTAGSPVERGGDEQREVGHGAADGRLDSTVDRLGAEHEPGLQPGPEAAALIHAPQGVVRLGEARRHPVDLRAKPAHGEEHAPSHPATEGFGEDEARARDVDRQSRNGGMVPALPSRLSAV
jgi:hypothetical protein